MFRRFTVPILAGAVALTGSLLLSRAADEPKVLMPEKAPESIPVKPVDLKDAAFDAYIDADVLAQAWSGLEPGALADIALKLAAGEKAVGRAHQKMPAEKLFGAALRVAADKKDIKTLERLVAETEKLKRDDLREQADLVLKLARTSRAADPLLMPNEKNSADTNIQLWLYNNAIQMARINRDADGLKTLEKSLADNPHLTGDIGAAMKKLIAATLKDLPTEADPALDALRKLAGASRGNVAQAGVLAISFDAPTGIVLAGSTPGLVVGTPPAPASAGVIAISTAPGNPPPGFKLPAPPKKVVPATTVKFSIINKVTQYNVAFDLVSPDGAHHTNYLKPNNTGTYSITFTAGKGVPAIEIYQVGGKAPLYFSVANGGNYQFLMDPKDSNKIKNYYQ